MCPHAGNRPPKTLENRTKIQTIARNTLIFIYF